jgi:hypothetical protein
MIPDSKQPNIHDEPAHDGPGNVLRSAAIIALITASMFGGWWWLISCVSRQVTP